MARAGALGLGAAFPATLQKVVQNCGADVKQRGIHHVVHAAAVTPVQQGHDAGQVLVTEEHASFDA